MAGGSPSLNAAAPELSGGTGISVDRRLLASVTGVDVSTLPVVHVGFPATAWALPQAALRRELQQRPAVRVRAGCRVLEVRMEENRSEAVVRTTDGACHLRGTRPGTPIAEYLPARLVRESAALMQTRPTS
jgi:hypothetical protein